MCFDSGGKEADKQAQQARADEAARQERIRQGTLRINELFEGGALSGAGQLKAGAKYDPTKTYYTSSGAVWKPPAQAPVGGGPGSPGGGHYEYRIKPTGDHGAASNQQTWVPNTPEQNAAALAAQKTPEQLFIEALGGGQIYSGQQKSEGTFGPKFYDNLRNSYISYATPQLVDQYGDAKKQLIYAMDRAGLGNSSANAVKGGELTKLYNTQKQDIAAKAGEYVNTTKANVEDSRNQLITTLNATGDAEGAAKGAINRAAALSAPPKFNPLTQLFTDFTAGLGQQAALERASYYSGQPVGRYNTGVFTPNRKSVAVT